MRQQFFHPAGPVRGQAREHILQVGIGVMPVHARRLHQAHHRRRRRLAAARRYTGQKRKSEKGVGAWQAGRVRGKGWTGVQQVKKRLDRHCLHRQRRAAGKGAGTAPPSPGPLGPQLSSTGHKAQGLQARRRAHDGIAPRCRQACRAACARCRMAMPSAPAPWRAKETKAQVFAMRAAARLPRFAGSPQRSNPSASGRLARPSTVDSVTSPATYGPL